MTSNLAMHKGKTREVSLAELEQIYAPDSTHTWRPLRHIEVVNTLKKGLDVYGYKIKDERYGVNSTGAKLFGVIDLESDLREGVGLSLGFRHANDKSMRLLSRAGGHVFVCDNMMLSGDTLVLSRKHTWGFNLFDELLRGLARFEYGVEKFRDKVNHLIGCEINDIEAEAQLARALHQKVVTQTTFDKAYDLYFDAPKMAHSTNPTPDCEARSLWGLHNSFTRALKELPFVQQMNTTGKVSEFFRV